MIADLADVKHLPYPNNVLFMLDISPVDIPDLAVAGDRIDKLIQSAYFTNKEIKIFYAYFLDTDNTTLRKVGSEVNLSIERVRQVLRRTCRKLYRFRAEIIGVKDLKSQKELLKAEIESLTKEVEALKREKTDLLSAQSNLFNDILHIQESINTCVDTYAEKFEKHTTETPTILVADMGFSVRAYNCLIRAGYRTLESLKSLTFNDLLHIRNMGRRSATEVKTILYEKYGVKIEEGE